MAFNKFMHPRNPYKEKPPNFEDLADKFETFRQFCRFVVTPEDKKVLFDFKNPEAVRALSWTLLKEDFDLNVELPESCLVPRIPSRLNYILWLEDIVDALVESGFLPADGQIWGLDIVHIVAQLELTGTGASVVYPFLGVRRSAKWNFVASEEDAEAFNCAVRNVETNDLRDRISLVRVTADAWPLSFPADRFPDVQFTFSLCNPPFFGRTELSGGEERGRKRTKRTAPHSATLAKPNEMFTDGGEVTFVGRLIDDSRQLRRRCLVYTSMLGKKSSVKPLKKKLRSVDAVLVAETVFCQGKTQRWALAWSFLPGISLSVASACCEKSQKQQVQTVQIVDYDCEAAADIFADVLRHLQIEFRRDKFAFDCRAFKDTWSRNRRKRRALDRLCWGQNKFARYSPHGAAELSSSSSSWSRRATDRGTLVKLGCGDGRDSFSLSGNFNAVECLPPDEKGRRRTVAVQAAISSQTVESVPLMEFSAEFTGQKGAVSARFCWKSGAKKEALNQIVQFARKSLCRVGQRTSSSSAR